MGQVEAQIGWVSWQGGELTASTVGVISLCLLAGLLGVGSRLESSRSWAGEVGGCGGQGEEQVEVVVVMGMGCECSGGDGDGGVEVVVVIGRGWEEGVPRSSCVRPSVLPFPWRRGQSWGDPGLQL